MIPEKDFPYVGIDAGGYRYNADCPPDRKKYGVIYGGYPDSASEVLFYDFAVQGYDVEFSHCGEKFHLLYESDHAARCDHRYTEEYEVFPDPMTLIRNLHVHGRPLIEIIGELDDVEPM